MTSRASNSPDEAIRRSWEAGNADAAITAVLEQHGPEILGWLVGILRDVDDANDVFSTFAERAVDHQRNEARRARRIVPLSASSEVTKVAERVRTTTLAHLKTANRQAISQLRDQLPPQDRMLLVLRVDRGLPWSDLARVFLDQPDPTAAELKREAARLRQRFHLIKEKLLKIGRDAGLVKETESET
ncbi:MAG: sigma-70 family RNA polymerase sigma factor [Deltaproteobacteria bacterium]|nr:MAG: sigma-70 family RNA polymerase sigma factor [Deltaproteobacteria bacterium]